MPSISGSWFGLTSALFDCLDRSLSCFFLFLQVQLLLFGCVAPTTAGHPATHRWPTLSKGKEGISELPPRVLPIFANILSRLRISLRCPAPTDPRAFEDLFLSVALYFAPLLWMAGRAGGARRWLELCMCVCVLCAPIPTLLERPGVGGENALSASAQGLRCWFWCLQWSAGRTEGRGDAWKLRGGCVDVGSRLSVKEAA